MVTEHWKIRTMSRWVVYWPPVALIKNLFRSLVSGSKKGGKGGGGGRAVGVGAGLPAPLSCREAYCGRRGMPKAWYKDSYRRRWLPIPHELLKKEKDEFLELIFDGIDEVEKTGDLRLCKDVIVHAWVYLKLKHRFNNEQCIRLVVWLALRATADQVCCCGCPPSAPAPPAPPSSMWSLHPRVTIIYMHAQQLCMPWPPPLRRAVGRLQRPCMSDEF